MLIGRNLGIKALFLISSMVLLAGVHMMGSDGKA
jgi:hypothetical protein